MFAPGSESHTSVAVKYEATMRTRAEFAEYRAGQELQDKAGRRRGGGRRIGLGRRAGVGALVAAKQAKELGEAADEATELYLEAFFARRVIEKCIRLHRGVEMGWGSGNLEDSLDACATCMLDSLLDIH